MLDNPFLWLILVGVVAATASIRGFIDNFTADVIFRKTRPEAVRLAGVVSFGLLSLVLLAVSPPETLPFLIILGFLASGIIDSIGSAPYSHALKYEEATGIAVLLQLNPIFALILGYFFLGDEINIVKLLAFALVLIAALVIIRSRGRTHQKIQVKTARFIVLAVLGWVISDILFVFLARNHEVHFMTAFFWFAVGKWLGDFGLLAAFKSWRTRFVSAFRAGPKRFLTTLSISEILRIFDNLVWRLAVIIAPTVAIASVTERTARLFLTFGFGLALSILWPKFGREVMTKKVVLMHLIAVTLAAVGVFLIQI